MADGERDPQWIRSAVRAVGHEWLEYARTAWAATVAPGRFARQWADGERAALNPFACLVNALALVTVFNVLLRLAKHGGDELPPWLDLLRPALQIFNGAVMASLFHFPLRLLGARRPWRVSLGVAFFVTAGPMLPLYLLRAVVAPIDFAAAQPHLSPVQLAINLAMSFALVALLVVALSGAHQVARWRAIVAFVLGASVLGGLVIALQLLTGTR